MMFLAPAHDKRRSFLARSLQFMGLGAASIALFVLAFGAFVATEFMFATPKNVYHRAWQAAPIFIYDPAALKDWEQWKHKFDSEIHTDEDAVRFANEMLKSINDPFTHLHTRDEVSQMKQSASGKFAGIGIGLGFKADADGKPVMVNGEVLPATNADGFPVVEKVFDGGPAASAGMKVGDAIKSANGVDLRGKDLTEIVKELKGKSGTQVKVVVQTDGAAEQTLDITRGIVKIPAVTTKRHGDIGYIRLDSFEQDTTVDEMKDALTKLNDTKSLVLDLRGNPGGRVDICIDLVSMFLESGDVVSIRNRVPFGGHSTTTYRLDKDGMTVEEKDESTNSTTSERKSRQAYMAQGKSIVILVNGHSASASEMFTGALKDNKRAIVVGEKTFGKGIGQMLLPMPNGTMLRITTLRYFTPNGTWLGDGSAAHHGITPDHVVAPGAGFKPNTATDNQLDFALKLLKESKQP